MKKPAKKIVKAAQVQNTGNTWNIHEKALKELERGVHAIHKQNYSDALTHFQTIIEGFPEEKELLDRTQMYIRVCRSQMDEKKTAAHRKPEEMFYLGVLKANEARYDEAVEFLDRALQANPGDEKVHYVMASTRAQKGEHELALKHLQEAITLNATNRVYAQNDPDFEPIRGDDGFQNLIYPEEA